MLFFLLILLMLVNYTADREKFLFAYRFNIAGLPINILDVLVAIASITALFYLSRRNYPEEKTHRGFKWSVGLLFLACFCSSIGGFIHNVELRDIADMARNVATMGLCIFIGYYSISTLKGARRAAYLILISSVASGLFVVLFLRDSIDSLRWSSTSFNELRNVNRGGDLGIIAAAFLIYGIVQGVRYFPRFIGLTFLAIATAGSFAMPHRSVWLAAVVSFLYAIFVLPSVRMSRRISASFMLGLGFVAFMAVGIVAYTNLTGRNFQEYIGVRVRSMLPGVEELKDNKPWETRLPGSILELKLWLESPLFGGGFAIQNVREKQTGGSAGMGYRHNVWTSALAEGGLPLFMGYLVTCLLLVVVGKRLVRARMDQGTVMMGAIASLHGFMSIVFAAATMTFNQQRPAIPLGLICGLLLRTRDMQLAVARSYEGYLDAEEGEFILPPIEEYA